MNQEILKKHSDASKLFNEVWLLDKEKLEGIELRFTEKIKALMHKVAIGTDRLDSVYDAGPFLRLLGGMVDDFGELFHIIYTTHLWEKLYVSETKGKNGKVEKEESDTQAK